MPKNTSGYIVGFISLFDSALGPSSLCLYHAFDFDFCLCLQVTLGAHKNARCEMEGRSKCPDAKTQVKFVFPWSYS